MSATPPVGTPCTMSVMNLIVSMQGDMTNAPTPTAAAADLQGTHLLYYEEHILGPSPAVKVEREGGLGTFGLLGVINGVPLVLLSPGNGQGFCLGRIGRDRLCLLQAGMCDVAKHDNTKLVVLGAMVNIMAPATKQTKFAAYEAPALAVASLTDAQYEDLTQKQHPVTDWNRIMLDIKAGRFDTEKEYEEIRLRASKKSVFSQAFTPRKKVKFSMEGATVGVQVVDLEASADIRSLLKPRRPVSEGAAHSLTEQEWEAVCTCEQLLSTRPNGS
jgi:hypothetical protein